MLWEEQVPMLRQGVHKELLNKAFGPASMGRKVYPPRELVFQAMRITAFDLVKVVIIGQDPYFNEHRDVGPEAHGLCFSVREGVPMPPSLRNIFQEINTTIYRGKPGRTKTDLTDWAEQGVLLINASLTVIAGQPNSHASLGWHELTDNIIEAVSEQREHVVFMLWGAFAQKKERLIDANKHLILKTSHPSPLSAHRGFLGSGIFVRCNEYLVKHQIEPVVW
ncbi:uracil-DNA glycosylase [Desulfopila aestuarii]|uniref:Uracil-DNA glycosylase n=1 Tax=Desulfopila aestuarii DSM 18488 TaxID=1121416 RepID=A0A1M7Y3Y7_9BACT|nr:uracil-DNA glycosylase [Desulfopila aestuarii]SHO46916.1 Uracil-DNA glycosylase [Desulfopila aestuarii DSM 18488]